MKNYKKSQVILYYTALIVIVILALVILGGYIQRRVQGIYQQAGDSIGEGELKD